MVKVRVRAKARARVIVRAADTEEIEKFKHVVGIDWLEYIYNVE